MLCFSERLQFAVFEIHKTVSKKLNEEEYGHLENEELEAFERVALLLL